MTREARNLIMSFWLRALVFLAALGSSHAVHGMWGRTTLGGEGYTWNPNAPTHPFRFSLRTKNTGDPLTFCGKILRHCIAKYISEEKAPGGSQAISVLESWENSTAGEKKWSCVIAAEFCARKLAHSHYGLATGALTLWARNWSTHIMGSQLAHSHYRLATGALTLGARNWRTHIMGSQLAHSYYGLATGALTLLARNWRTYIMGSQLAHAHYGLATGALT